MNETGDAVKMPALPIAIRELRPEDRAFVFTSWMKSYVHSEFARRISAESWRDYHAVIEHLLTYRRTLVATPVEMPDVILGFACADDVRVPTEGKALHYLFVKEKPNSFRRVGIAARLWVEIGSPLVITHRTHQADSILFTMDRERAAHTGCCPRCDRALTSRACPNADCRFALGPDVKARAWPRFEYNPILLMQRVEDTYERRSAR